MITSTTSSVTHHGAGTTGPFAVPFDLLEAADLEAYLVDTATLARTDLAQPADYTVDLVLGQVTTAVAVPVGTDINLERNPPLTQPYTFTPASRLHSSRIESALDRLVMQFQARQRSSSPAPTGHLFAFSGDTETTTNPGAGTWATLATDELLALEAGSFSVADEKTAVATYAGPVGAFLIGALAQVRSATADQIVTIGLAKNSTPLSGGIATRTAPANPAFIRHLATWAIAVLQPGDSISAVIKGSAAYNFVTSAFTLTATPS